MYRANGHTYRNKLHHDFHMLLCDEADQRDKRGVAEWPLMERRAMWKRVNEERIQLGKVPVPLEEVARVEQTALGHTDYGTKYALYCTELVENTP